MFNRKAQNGIIYYASSLLDSYSIPHLFATRFGGVSCGDFDSLNISSTRKDKNGFTDTPQNILENYRRALSVLGTVPELSFAPNQIHSSDVVSVDKSYAGFGVLPSFRNKTGFDGAVLAPQSNGINALCVKTADCVPILLANIKTGAICALHAGWRGTVCDIVTNAVQKLGQPKDIIAAIGPCISVCCYEVGNEVYDAAYSLLCKKGIGDLINTVFTVCPTCSAATKMYADLSKLNSILLQSAGLSAENIDVCGLCTCCYRDEYDKKPFFSHRAYGGFSGTFISAIRTFYPEESK